MADNGSTVGDMRVQVPLNRPKILRKGESIVKNEKLKHCLYEIFKQLDIRPTNKGYSYAMEAVILRFKQFDDSKWTKMGSIYRTIAKNNSDDYKNVERAIRYARKNIFDNPTSHDFAVELFGEGANEKLSNGAFVGGICSYMKYFADDLNLKSSNRKER